MKNFFNKLKYLGQQMPEQATDKTINNKREKYFTAEVLEQLEGLASDDNDTLLSSPPSSSSVEDTLDLLGNIVIIIGVIGGLIVVMSIVMLDKMKIDDPVGAISAHGTCGIWGLLAVTLTGGSLGAQIYGALMIFLWTFIVSYIFWSLIKMFFGLRVTEEEESDGVDISECGLEAYPEFSKASGAKPSVYPEQ